MDNEAQNVTEHGNGDKCCEHCELPAICLLRIHSEIHLNFSENHTTSSINCGHLSKCACIRSIGSDAVHSARRMRFSHSGSCFLAARCFLRVARKVIVWPLENLHAAQIAGNAMSHHAPPERDDHVNLSQTKVHCRWNNDGFGYRSMYAQSVHTYSSPCFRLDTRQEHECRRLMSCSYVVLRTCVGRAAGRENPAARRTSNRTGEERIAGPNKPTRRRESAIRG
jgi:hypothetical protein